MSDITSHFVIYITLLKKKKKPISLVSQTRISKEARDNLCVAYIDATNVISVTGTIEEEERVRRSWRVDRDSYDLVNQCALRLRGSY